VIAGVAAAVGGGGGWKAGTPFEIASTPVSAVAPCEKALRIANRETAAAVVAAPGISSEWTPTGGHPPTHLIRPTATSSRIETTNPDAGNANSAPGSRA